MVTQSTLTRDASFYNLKSLPKSRAEVLEIIERHGPITDYQIAKLLDRPVNRVTGRRGELVDAGLIQAVGRIKNTDTGEANTLWRVAESTPIVSIIEKAPQPAIADAEDFRPEIPEFTPLYAGGRCIVDNFPPEPTMEQLKILGELKTARDAAWAAYTPYNPLKAPDKQVPPNRENDWVAVAETSAKFEQYYAKLYGRWPDDQVAVAIARDWQYRRYGTAMPEPRKPASDAERDKNNRRRQDAAKHAASHQQ